MSTKPIPLSFVHSMVTKDGSGLLPDEPVSVLTSAIPPPYPSQKDGSTRKCG